MSKGLGYGYGEYVGVEPSFVDTIAMKTAQKYNCCWLARIPNGYVMQMTG
ncbi:hypothetical protein ABNG30_29475 [Bacillus thuringiensis]